MTRGYPDYSPGAARSAEGEFLPTIAEAPVWFKDDFEFPACKWFPFAGTATINTSFVIGAVTYYPYLGSSMMVCTSGVGAIFQFQRDIGTPPQTSNLGFSMLFLFSTKADWLDSEESLVLIDTNFWAGTLHDLFYISYNPRTGNWYYFDADRVRILIGNFEIEELSWHYIKLIINPVLKQYVSLQVDWRNFDLSGIAYRSTGLAAAERYRPEITGRADATDTVYLLVDNYKITYGET